MKKTLITLLSVMSMSAYAQSNSQLNSPEITGYLVDSNGHAVRVSDGSCVRTGSYDPVTAYHPECNPKIVSQQPVVPVAQPPVLVTNTPEVIETLFARVTFQFDSSQLSTIAKDRIDKLLSHTKAKKVRIEAGTDFIGSNRYNQRLSQRRAEAIANYVKTTSNITITGIVATGETKAHRQNEPECQNIKHDRQALIDCIEEDRVGVLTLVLE